MRPGLVQDADQKRQHRAIDTAQAPQSGDQASSSNSAPSWLGHLVLRPCFLISEIQVTKAMPACIIIGTH